MKNEARPANDYLQNQNCQAPPGVASRRFVQKVDQEKAYGEGAADDWNPLGPAKETVRGVIGKAEEEVSCKPSRGEEEHPLGPVAALSRYIAVHEQQAAQPHVRERRGEGSGVSEAADSVFVEKAAIEVEQDAGPSDGNRRPCDAGAKT